MRNRLIFGSLLAATLLVLLVIDAVLAARPAPVWLVPGTSINVGPWLYNGAITTAIVLVLTVLAVHELVRIAKARGYHPFGVSAQVFAAALVVGPYVSANSSSLTGGYDESLGMLWLAIALGYVFLRQAMLYRTSNAMEHIAITLFLIFYAGGLAGFMTKLRMEVGGAAGVVVLLFSMCLVKMADVGAYFTGRLIGRNKMVPWLSPKKTWEGFAGGMITTVLAALAIGTWLHTSGLARLEQRHFAYPWVFMIIGLVLGLFSAAGDLCASLLKRDAAVKDSGRALPGLGGVLDVIDSPLLAAPVAWFIWTRVFHVVT